MKNNFSFKIKKLKQCGFIEDIDKDFTVVKVSPLKAMESFSIIFAKKIDDAIIEKMMNLKGCLFIMPSNTALSNEILESNEVIFSNNPRLLFAQIMSFIIKEQAFERKYTEAGGNIIVGENVEIGQNVIIEPFVFIDHDVKIGDNCIIKTGVKIRENVIMGEGCIIGENSVIGGQGLGTEKDEESGQNFRIPHMGGVLMGNHVEIGSLTTVLSGTIEPTVLEDFVFIDDLNHVAHNCKIGQGTVTAGCVQISGSARIGKGCFVAPNATIRNGRYIGDSCFIGQATSITKNVEDGMTVAGNPGEELNRMKTWRKIQNKLVDEFEE